MKPTGVEWRFVQFAPGRFRLVRLEHMGEMARMTLVAEQPEGEMLAALQPYIVSQDDLDYHRALAAQRQEQDSR